MNHILQLWRSTVVSSYHFGYRLIPTRRHQDYLEKASELLARGISGRELHTPARRRLRLRETKRGASLIVWAIAEGRKMAVRIDRYLQANRPAKRPSPELTV
jgi:hypothetical protein